MSDEPKKDQAEETELSEEQTEQASGGTGGFYLDDFQAFRSLGAVQETNTDKSSGKDDSEQSARDFTVSFGDDDVAPGS